MPREADHAKSLARRRRLAAATALFSAVHAVFATVQTAFKLWPTVPRTRAPSLFATFYSRLLPGEFRKQFRLPRELFAFVLDVLIAPRDGHEHGLLYWE